MTFDSSNTAYVTTSAPTGSDPTYTDTVTGASPGTAIVTVTGYDYGTPYCSQTISVNVTNGQWWQVGDGDVSTNGSLTDQVATGDYFDLAGSGGYPGVPSYGTTTNLTSSNVSATGWLTHSSETSPTVYNYSYFESKIPSDTVINTITDTNVDGSYFESGGTESYGYYWYEYDGSTSGLDLTINSAADLGDRKVVLLVKSANLYLNGPINLTDGQGFFLTVAGKDTNGDKGNIYVGDTVGGTSYDLEGLYLADNVFDTGSASTQLSVRGSVVGGDGINLGRDLGASLNATTPAEYFQYAPDQIMLFPSKLGFRRLKWKEVAP